MSNVEPVSAAVQDYPMSLTILQAAAMPRSGRIASQLTDSPGRLSRGGLTARVHHGRGRHRPRRR